MKRLFIYTIMVVIPFIIICCKANSDHKTSHINGTITSKLNGKKIFLVPVIGLQDAAHVDSVVVQDGSFSFNKDTVGVYSIRVDYHYREGMQELLIVTEPGEVNVSISSNSISSGTPQNDSLQVWKDFTISQNKKFSQLKASGANEEQIKAFQNNFIKANADFVKRQQAGVLKDFLQSMYHIN